MRKRFMPLVILAVIVVLLGIIYLFVPSYLIINQSLEVKCTLNGSKRMIMDLSNWDRWWPEAKNSSTNSYSYKSKAYIPGIISFNGIAVTVANGNATTKTALNILPLEKDSVLLQWQSGQISFSANPIKRIQQYRQAQKLKKEIANLLQQLKSFLEKKSNIYGAEIREVKVKDSILIATRFHSDSLPGIEPIYSAIRKLKNYIAEQQATENNFPMKHTDHFEDYETMVAIPVNKELPEKNGMMVKRMVLGNILEAEIKGGPATVQKGLLELENYKQDYGKESPAIPFELLVTDRSKEPDTTKWITRIYYPVF